MHSGLWLHVMDFWREWVSEYEADAGDIEIKRQYWRVPRGFQMLQQLKNLRMVSSQQLEP